jgi:hypothetical protein
MTTTSDDISPGEFLIDLAIFIALIIAWLWPPKE